MLDIPTKILLTTNIVGEFIDYIMIHTKTHLKQIEFFNKAINIERMSKQFS